MIKSIKIVNFQSHKKTEIDFEEGLNVICGNSQHGKSAIMRSIMWVLNNKPSSGKIHYNKTKNPITSVEIKTENNEIKLTKKFEKGIVKDSIYSINEDVKLRKFGKNVPDEISKILNLSDLNIQKQHDSSFLIGQTSGQIAKEINNITKLDIADIWIQKLTKKINSLKTDINYLENDIEKDKKEFDKYKGIENIEKDINSANSTEKKINELISKVNTLIDSKEQLDSIFKDLKRTKPILAYVKKNLIALESLSDDLKAKQSLTKQIEYYIYLNNEMKTKKKLLKETKKDIVNVEKITEQLYLLKEKNSKLQQIQKLDKHLLELKKEVSIEKTKYKEEMSKLNICPTCNQIIK